MKKATPGNNYVFLKRQEIGYSEYSGRNQAEWQKYKAEFLSTLPKDEAEKRAFKFWKKRTVKPVSSFWINVKFKNKIDEYVKNGFSVELTGWANKFGTIVIDM